MSKSKIAPLLVASALAFGCGSSPTETPDGGGGDAAPTPRSHTFAPRDFACTDTTATSCMTSAPTLADSARTVTLNGALGGVTRAYVVDQITLPEAASVTGRLRAAGFNLDGMDVRESSPDLADCTRRDEDFLSVSEEGVVGIDNALQRFIPTIEGLLTDCPGGTQRGCLDAALRDQITQGNLILIVEVAGIDDFANDDAVTVQILLGQAVAAGVPTLGADGRLASGGAYTVAVGPGGAPLLLGPAYTGDIFHSRLRIRTDLLALSINTGARQLDLTLANAEIRFNISSTDLTNGMIGGALRNDDIITAAAMVSAGSEGLVRAAVESAADISPTANPATCGMVSVGITFEATTANLTR